MTTKTNKISPLEELRIENAGSLLFNSAVNGAKKSLGLASPKSKGLVKKDEEAEEPKSVLSNLWGMTKASWPLLLEIAQPMVMAFVMKKVKDKFSGKGTKK